VGWEYILFSYWLFVGLEQRSSAYNDHRLQFALGGRFIPTAELVDYIQSEFAAIQSVTETFERLLLGPGQEAAMGSRGEEGDPDLIEHFASRLLQIYDELLAWSHRLRSATTTLQEGRATLRALADYAVQPIEAVRTFVVNLREQMDGLNATLESGESVELHLVIAFEVPESVADRYESAFDGLTQALN
jgi:hypothetical protein